MFEKITGVVGSSGCKGELLVLHDSKVITCYALYIVPYIACIPCFGFVYKPMSTLFYGVLLVYSSLKIKYKVSF